MIWLFIGTLWLNGEYVGHAEKEYPTQRACLAAVHKMGMRPSGTGGWILTYDDGEAMRAMCVGGLKRR